VLGDGKALELLGEVFHHVVALGLAVDEHVQPQVLLYPDAMVDLLLHRLLVNGGIDQTFTQAFALLTNGGRLRKRADRRGGPGRQCQALLLDGAALRMRAAALAERIVPRGQCRLHLGTVHAGAFASRSKSLSLLLERPGHAVSPLLEGAGQAVQFLKLLYPERQPRAQRLRQASLGIQIHRHMHQGARGR